MEKNILGFEVNCKDNLELTLPDKAAFKKYRAERIYNNKDFFWNSIKPVIEFMNDFNSVRWVGGDTDLQIDAMSATRVLREKKSAATKDYMVDFYCYFFSVDSNVMKLADCLVTKKGFDLAKVIVEKGAICLADVPKEMSWAAYKVSYWGDNTDRKTLERWKESKDTSALSMMSFIISGAAPKMQTSRSYYTPNYPFIMPGYKMMQFVIGKEHKTLEVFDIPDPKDKNLTLFSGDDLFGNEETLQSLILSGVIAAGKMKIGINAVKKLNGFIPLRQFPEGCECVMSRSEYLANAAFLTFGEPGDMEFPESRLTDQQYLKAMYENIQITSRYYLMSILSEYVKGMAQEFYYVNRIAIRMLFNGFANALKEGFHINTDGWIDYDSLCWRANYLLSVAKFGYIYPDNYSLRPEYIKDVAGKPMAPTDFKAHIHDVILRAMIEGFAAIGGADLLYNAEGKLLFLRISEAGKWYLGMTTEMPKAKSIANISDSIDVDDQTGLILVKNPNYPYLNLLPEFAEKMTDTRYCFSEKAFLKKCENPEMLEAKIKRFKMFILPEPGPHITALIDRMEANCNLVKKTSGGSTFQLWDIDPKNSRLHSIILDNKEIRKNSLRVEGCKLLVKSKFLPRFFEILTENGYLNELPSNL